MNAQRTRAAAPQKRTRAACRILKQQKSKNTSRFLSLVILALVLLLVMQYNAYEDLRADYMNVIQAIEEDII